MLIHIYIRCPIYKNILQVVVETPFINKTQVLKDFEVKGDGGLLALNVIVNVWVGIPTIIHIYFAIRKDKDGLLKGWFSVENFVKIK